MYHEERIIEDFPVKVDGCPEDFDVPGDTESDNEDKVRIIGQQVGKWTICNPDGNHVCWQAIHDLHGSCREGQSLRCLVLMSSSSCQSTSEIEFFCRPNIIPSIGLDYAVGRVQEWNRNALATGGTFKMELTVYCDTFIM